jgi:hypothetical protein
MKIENAEAGFQTASLFLPQNLFLSFLQASYFDQVSSRPFHSVYLCRAVTWQKCPHIFLAGSASCPFLPEINQIGGSISLVPALLFIVPGYL